MVLLILHISNSTFLLNTHSNTTKQDGWGGWLVALADRLCVDSMADWLVKQRTTQACIYIVYGTVSFLFFLLMLLFILDNSAVNQYFRLENILSVATEQKNKIK